MSLQIKREITLRMPRCSFVKDTITSASKSVDNMTTQTRTYLNIPHRRRYMLQHCPTMKIKCRRCTSKSKTIKSTRIRWNWTQKKKLKSVCFFFIRNDRIGTRSGSNDIDYDFNWSSVLVFGQISYIWQIVQLAHGYDKKIVAQRNQMIALRTINLLFHSKQLVGPSIETLEFT